MEQAPTMPSTSSCRRCLERGSRNGPAFDHPEHVVGIHLSDMLQPFVGAGAPPLSDAERSFVETEAPWAEEEGAYDHVQRTKPQTLAYGLTDSPAGLAAWIVEKLRSWSDCGGELSRRFSLDDVATLLTLYWAERAYNVRRFTRMPRGGHFAAFEEPDLLATDLRAFFRPLR
jgi:pimeloyl-ACP methyl ester carboxylesterase